MIYTVFSRSCSSAQENSTRMFACVSSTTATAHTSTPNLYCCPLSNAVYVWMWCTCEHQHLAYGRRGRQCAHPFICTWGRTYESSSARARANTARHINRKPCCARNDGLGTGTSLSSQMQTHTFYTYRSRVCITWVLRTLLHVINLWNLLACIAEKPEGPGYCRAPKTHEECLPWAQYYCNAYKWELYRYNTHKCDMYIHAGC